MGPIEIRQLSFSMGRLPLLNSATTRRGALFSVASMIALAACGSGGAGDTGPATTPIPKPTFTPLPVPVLTGAARNPLSVLTLGMSVFLGADIVGPNYPNQGAFITDNTPTRYFTKALIGARRPIDGAVSEFNAAVGGAFDNDVGDQYASAPGKPYTIVILGLAMNSGSTFGVHGRGPNAAFTKEKLRGFLRDIIASGAVPFVCNTMHPWPEKITPQSIVDGLFDGIAWPLEQQTLQFSGALAYDQVNSQFGTPTLDDQGRGIFARPGGGQSIKAGSKLMIQSDGGSNAGIILTVTAPLNATTVTVEPGVIRESGLLFGTVRHYAPPIDEFLVPPSTQQREYQDWTGSGVIVDGLASYATWNTILTDLCREENVKLIDLEYRGFKWVERYGWPSVYTSTYAGVEFDTVNHPQLAAQRVVYGDMMRWLAIAVDNALLAPGFEVLRGPAVV